MMRLQFHPSKVFILAAILALQIRNDLCECRGNHVPAEVIVAELLRCDFDAAVGTDFCLDCRAGFRIPEFRQ